MADITTATPTGVGDSDPLNGAAGPTPTIFLSVSPTAVTTCQNITINWTIGNSDTADLDITPMTLLYSNVNVTQSTYSPPLQEYALTVQPISRHQYIWTVWITDPGNYVINASASEGNPAPVIVQSSPFTLEPGDSTCLAPSSSMSMDIPTSPPAQNPAQSSSATPVAGHSSSKTAAIAGGTVAAIAVVACILVFLLLRRRRNNKIANNVGGLNVNSRGANGRGHKKWGGLSSIDKLQQGEIPVVIPANSPYASPTYNRNRSGSTGNAMTDDEGLEKGYGEDVFPVDADALSQMPTLDSNRGSRRYSSDAVSNVLKQNSGLAAFHEEHTRHHLAPPVLSMTTATYNGGDDPFSDASYVNRGKRASALSVPSTARAPSRLSDSSARPTPSPVPTPAASNPPSQNNTMARNTSATASLGRPARKPVPQYSNNSIELTNTSKTSPTSYSSPNSYSSHSHISRGNTSDTSPTSPSRKSTLTSPTSATRSNASPIDSSAYWLQDKAPVANRNIGLAGQGDGPVHYLMPDLPPQ